VQTAQDYAIVVDDPEEDDMDPDEWRDFFQQFGHVTFVTIAVSNGELLKMLVEKRLLENEIAMDTPDDIEERKANASENFLKIRDLIVKIGIFGLPKLGTLKEKLTAVKAKIATEVENANYKACKVFVIFETEQGQRRCLKALTRGTIPAAFDWHQGGGVWEEHREPASLLSLARAAASTWVDAPSVPSPLFPESDQPL
jgi:hypothetical protein